MYQYIVVPGSGIEVHAFGKNIEQCAVQHIDLCQVLTVRSSSVAVVGDIPWVQAD